MRVCSNCGKENLDNSKFCTNCGNKIEIESSIKPSSNNKNVAIVLVIILVIIGILVYKNNKEKTYDFSSIYNKIGCTYKYCDLASDGSYLEIDTNPYDEDDYFSYDAARMIEEANKALGFTDALYNRMGKTRALDGTQIEEKKQIKVTWTYHPDDGLEVVYAKK